MPGSHAVASKGRKWSSGLNISNRVVYLSNRKGNVFAGFDHLVDQRTVGHLEEKVKDFAHDNNESVMAHRTIIPT